MSGERPARLPERDRPWMMRTYAGHSTAKASNELYRRNLAKGQTGLSIAFDLPTQTGYDPDDELARGEVGKVGVPISHRGDMAALMDGIPLDEMNTSMTINATAAWLLALYIVTAEQEGVAEDQLQGTTQNDIIKEFLARGTYAFPPAPSMRLIADMIAYTVEHVPRWNPINICSYHLQEAGATPVQEIAYAMSNAIAVLDAARERVEPERMEQVFGRISFFVNAGVRFIEEHAKLRAMSILWEQIGTERYGVQDPRHLRFRYGVQVNSLGLTEVQPENNVQRIVLEALAVTLGRDARARAIQLPAWNEALGLPRPWDQQWSLRIQQVLAYETDILEYGDIFEGSKVMDGARGGAARGSPRGDGRGGPARRRRRGGPVHEGGAGGLPPRAAAADRERRAGGGRPEPLRGDRGVPAHRRRRGRHPGRGPGAGSRADRGDAGLAGRAATRAPCARRSSSSPRRPATRAAPTNLMVPTIAAARAGATTGEWAATLRGVFGSYRAPTGVGEASAGSSNGELAELRAEVERLQEQLGRRPKMLVGKPGLDGHSNGAEQVALRARDAGMDVVYDGIRLTPAQIATSALQEGVHVIGLSILSGSHRELIPAVMEALRDARRPGAGDRRGHHPRAGRARPAPGRGRRRLHAEGLRHHAHHARDRGAPRRGSRAPGARRRQRARVSPDGAALAARLRERDLAAAPAALNLLESNAPEERLRGRCAARRARPGGARRRGAGARDRRDRPAGGGQVDDALGAARGLARARAARSPCWPWTRAPGARADRCWETARGSTSTPPTAGC